MAKKKAKKKATKKKAKKKKQRQHISLATSPPCFFVTDCGGLPVMPVISKGFHFTDYYKMGTQPQSKTYTAASYVEMEGCIMVM